MLPNRAYIPCLEKNMILESFRNPLETDLRRITRFVVLQVFKLYLFARSVNSFVETLEAFLEGDDNQGDEALETLIRDKFVSGFRKLTEGFSLFQQVQYCRFETTGGGVKLCFIWYSVLSFFKTRAS